MLIGAHAHTISCPYSILYLIYDAIYTYCSSVEHHTSLVTDGNNHLFECSDMSLLSDLVLDLYETIDNKCPPEFRHKKRRLQDKLLNFAFVKMVKQKPMILQKLVHNGYGKALLHRCITSQDGKPELKPDINVCSCLAAGIIIIHYKLTRVAELYTLNYNC